MNLSQFIQQSLCEICEGIENANKRLKQIGSEAVVNPEKTQPFDTGQQFYGILKPDQQLYPSVHLIKFNVAVFAQEGEEAKGGIGVVVASIALGSQARSEQKSGSETRLEFGIPILLPQGRKDS